MGNLAVYAHAAPADALHLWVGRRSLRVAPALRFELDGREVAPEVLRPMAPVRTPPCTFTGMFALRGLQSDRRYAVTVRADDGEIATLRTRTLPRELEEGQTFRVLLSSCFHNHEATRGALNRLVGEIPWDHRPHLVMLMGDQVYLDLPTEKDFKDDERWLEETFEQNYVTNWFASELTNLLAMAPIVCAPDDHEYWNNFPDRAIVVENTHHTHGAEGKRRWERAAKRMFEAFQLAPTSARAGDGVRVDVSPLSFYVLDTRSTRTEGGKKMLSDDARDAFVSWAERLAPEATGVVVTGQSLLEAPVSEFSGRAFDWELANYTEDFRVLLTSIYSAARKTRGFLLLTGDVHWGRVSTVHDGQDTLLHEIISSPSALVTTLVADPLKELWHAAGSILRRSAQAWPRHSEAPKPWAWFGRGVLGSGVVAKRKIGQRGDQVALVAITRTRAGCKVRVTYYSLGETPLASSTIELDFPRA